MWRMPQPWLGGDEEREGGRSWGEGLGLVGGRERDGECCACQGRGGEETWTCTKTHIFIRQVNIHAERRKTIHIRKNKSKAKSQSELIAFEQA